MSNPYRVECMSQKGIKLKMYCLHMVESVHGRTICPRWFADQKKEYDHTNLTKDWTRTLCTVVR